MRMRYSFKLGGMAELHVKELDALRLSIDLEHVQNCECIAREPSYLVEFSHPYRLGAVVTLYKAQFVQIQSEPRVVLDHGRLLCLRDP
jgi:hypothetical protein